MAANITYSGQNMIPNTPRSEEDITPSSGQNMFVGFTLSNVPPETCADTVYKAIKAGYRIFDGACDYGNEKQAGEGVRRALTEGLVKRKELTIATKLWPTFHAKEHVTAMARMKLKLWGLEYFDIFSLHYPIALGYVNPEVRYPPGWYHPDTGTVLLQNTPIHETWAAMEALVDLRITKSIGISNCQGSLLLDILRHARIKPQVLQVELHPYLTQEDLVVLAKRLEMTITAYLYIGNPWTTSLLEDSIVVSIAERLKVSPMRVLLRWAIQRGAWAIAMWKTDGENITQPDVQSFKLTYHDMRRISGLNRNLRMDNPANIDPMLSIFA